MKIASDAILQPAQAAYLDNLLPASEGVLAEMERYAAAHGVPISDKETAIFFEITARAIDAQKVLEIGLAIGYGAIHFLRGMKETGTVTAIEPSDEMIAAAERFSTAAGLRERLKIEKGTALKILPQLTGAFDLIYLDAVKEEYAAYLEKSLPLLKIGGVILADNVLWGGQVADEIREEKYQKSTVALREFNQLFVSHEQLHATILPVGDGLGYAVKIK